MIYAKATDWAGLGQFLLGVAAILALVLQQMSTKRKLNRVGEQVQAVNHAVNGRTSVTTVSDDIAETRMVALDTKETVAQLQAGLPALMGHLAKQDKTLNALKSDTEELKLGHHVIAGKVEQIGKTVSGNTERLDNHLAFHQAQHEKEVTNDQDMAEGHTGEGG